LPAVGEVVAALAPDGIQELVGPHADQPVQPPEVHGDALLLAGAPPREGVVEGRVDERAVDVEEGGSGGSGIAQPYPSPGTATPRGRVRGAAR
jgi:hypothetical protein